MLMFYFQFRLRLMLKLCSMTQGRMNPEYVIIVLKTARLVNFLDVRQLQAVTSVFVRADVINDSEIILHSAGCKFTAKIGP